MRSRARRSLGRGRTRSAAVEPLEGRALLSYLVVPKGDGLVPVHVSDARRDQPLHSNGLAGKQSPRFYNLYDGPRRPDLNGVRAVGYVTGTNLILSGTVAGPIVQHPRDASQEALYTFGIDRGGASKVGPFPGRPKIRIDAEVVALVGQKGITATVRLDNRNSLQFLSQVKALPASSVAISGDTITVVVPLSALPSTGRAFNQWVVNFFPANPAGKSAVRSVASFTPEFTQFQVAVKPPAGL